MNNKSTIYHKRRTFKKKNIACFFDNSSKLTRSNIKLNNTDEFNNN